MINYLDIIRDNSKEVSLTLKGCVSYDLFVFNTGLRRRLSVIYEVSNTP